MLRAKYIFKNKVTIVKIRLVNILELFIQIGIQYMILLCFL